LELAELSQGGSILAALRFPRPISEAILALQAMTKTPSANVLAGQVAFDFGLPTILACSSEFWRITPSIRTAVGLCEHREKGRGGVGDIGEI